MRDLPSPTGDLAGAVPAGTARSGAIPSGAIPTKVNLAGSIPTRATPSRAVPSRPSPRARWALLACVAVALLVSLAASPAIGQDESNLWKKQAPKLLLEGVHTHIVVVPPEGAPPHNTVRLLIQRKDKTYCLGLTPSGNRWVTDEFTLTRWGTHRAFLVDLRGNELAHWNLRALPGFLSLLPPLFAITMALVTRQVLVSLLLGIWLGGVLVAGPNLFSGTLRSLDTTIVGAVANSDHVKVILFTLFLGGMVGVMSKSGGTMGIVQSLVRRATTPRRGSLAAWVLGLIVFFDDYANTIIIGPTLRPITDKLRISREKLAYFVDSTAAPVASIAIISTWIGTEIGLIGDALQARGSDLDPYKVFLETLPYRFYPILALAFGFLVAVMGRDFGPMAKAESRARTGEVLRRDSEPLSDFEGEDLRPKPQVVARARNAFLPIATVVVATLVGLWFTGAPGAGSPSLLDLFRNPRPLRLLGDVIGAADSYTALLWASALGGIVALALSQGRRMLSLTEGISAWVGGVRSMLLAVMILVLAWSLGSVCGDIGTSPYLVGLLSEHLNPHILPLLIFVVAGAVSFATGTSWGTMAILVPLTIPLAMETCEIHGWGAGPSHRILLGSISSVLAGAVWGDHCSPISDTTVLSSMATSCDHMDHVRTQLPYALVVGIVGILLGDLASAFGMSPWLSILLAIVVFVLFLRFLGRPARAPARDD